MRYHPLFPLLCFVILAGCQRRPDNELELKPTDVPHYTYTVERTWPHDKWAFTEGLFYWEGNLYESTGLNGSSTLRKTELTTGKVLTQIHLPDAFFGEGTTILDGKIYQLTWQSHRGLIYDFDTFVKLGEFSYKGEGWGLTTDGHSLIMSDGTNNLRFLDPTRFTIQRTIAVLSQDKPLTKLNELEYVNGEIYANIWQTDQVARIDPKTGRLLGLIDFGGLLSPEDRDDRTDVLNGIAYDPQGKRLFVTGKNWPKLFQVTIKSAP